MSYLKHMAIKGNFLFRFFLVTLSLTLFSCPSEENNCNGLEGDTIKEDLAIITPLKTIYQQGEIIKITINLPAVNDYFGGTTNLLYVTNDDTCHIGFGTLNEIINGNQVTVLKGTQGAYSNVFDFPFNPSSGNYEFEIEVKLNRLGNYSFVTSNTEIMRLSRTTNCNLYVIGTNFAGRNADRKIEFTVE